MKEMKKTDKSSTKRTFCLKAASLWLMVLAFALTLFGFDTAKAFAVSEDSKISKVLFFVNSEEEYNMILDWQNEGAETNGNLYDSNLFDIRLTDEVNEVNLSFYLAISIPYGANIDNSKIQNVFNSGTYVYLYGSLTINEYKDAVGLEKYSLNVNINGSGDDVVTQVEQYFDSDYEEDEAFNIIGYSNKALLCKISDESIAAYTY